MVVGNLSISFGTCMSQHVIPPSTLASPLSVIAHLGTGVSKDSHELARKTLLVRFTSEERDGFTGLASSSRSSTSMHKVL